MAKNQKHILKNLLKYIINKNLLMYIMLIYAIVKSDSYLYIMIYTIIHIYSFHIYTYIFFSYPFSLWFIIEY